MFKKRSEIFDSNFVYFIILSMFVAIRIISSTVNVGEIGGYVLNFVIQVVLMFGMSIFLFSYLRKQKLKTTFKQYGFNKINFKAILLSILIGILVYFGTIFVSTFFSAIITMLGYEPSSQGTMTEYPVWLLITELIFTALLPGICEETANRGMLLKTYNKMGAKKAILLSGLLFGLMHLNINQFFYASIIGFFFGFVALLTDSIYPTMIMHFVNNALSTLMGFSLVNNLPVGTFINNCIQGLGQGNAFLAILEIFLIIMLIISLMLFLTLQLFKQTKVQSLANMANDMMKTELRKELMGELIEEEQNEDGEVVLEQRTINNKKIFNVVLNKGMYLESIYKPQFKDNIFLYVNLFMSVVLTIFTFVWGVI